VFGALLVPAAGSLLTVLFSRPAERARAFAVYGAVAGSGSAIGLLVGGLLTEYANWRWCLLVNVPVAAAVVAAVALVPASRAAGGARYDLPGAVLGTAGLVAVVYGAGHAAEHGWTSGGTVAAGLVGAALLAAFAAVEARSAHPLLPVRIVLDRNRGGAYLASVLSAAGVLATFLFLTYYFQVVLGYGPVRAGLGALPITAGVLLAAAAAGRLMPLVGARPLIRYGALTAAAASLWLTRVGVSTGYLTHVLPAAVALGIGFGLVIVPLSNLALLGVPPRDAGAASAVFNATQQVGGSLGTAVLNTVCTVAVAGYLADHPAAVRPALVHGYTTAFWWGAALLLASAVAVSALLRRSAARPG
jgi:MFS family permease